MMRSVFPELIPPGDEQGYRQRGSGAVTSRMWWLKRGFWRKEVGQKPSCTAHKLCDLEAVT